VAGWLAGWLAGKELKIILAQSSWSWSWDLSLAKEINLNHVSVRI
jgi:hypothetical protein